MSDDATVEKPPHLAVHEWAAVAAIILLTLVLIAIILFSTRTVPASELGDPHYAADKEIEIVVEGAVEKPGVYRFTRGALVKDALALAIPTPEARLTRFKLEQKLHKGQVLKVPKKKEKGRRKKEKGD